jgi:uracil-DNA glycosylase family 4
MKAKLKIIPAFTTFEELNACVTNCKLCPRLVKFRENVPEKEKFSGVPYWKKPVPGFGDPKAYLLILGLAPSAQGGNRTGRIFTGDESARFLFKALYSEGFANKPTSETADDGLILNNCYMTAAVKCVPPQNKPNAIEQKHCFPYLLNEISLLKNLLAVLALGNFAFQAFLQYIQSQGGPKINTRFRHADRHLIDGFPTVYTCYHPSPQNTNTGKLNQTMICKVLKQIKADRSHIQP